MSVDRTEEWKRLCISILLGGSYDDDDDDDDDMDISMLNFSSSSSTCKIKSCGENESSSNGGIVLNLLPSMIPSSSSSSSSMDDGEEKEKTSMKLSSNGTGENHKVIGHYILELEESILDMTDVWNRNMVRYIRAYDCILPNHDDDDDDSAEWLESTIATFVASTANQLKELHEQINSSSQPTMTQQTQHYAGMVQGLLQMLNGSLAQRFATCQQLRHRPTITSFSPEKILSISIPPPPPTSSTTNPSNDTDTTTTWPPSFSIEEDTSIPSTEEQDFLNTFIIPKPQPPKLSVVFPIRKKQIVKPPPPPNIIQQDDNHSNKVTHSPPPPTYKPSNLPSSTVSTKLQMPTYNKESNIRKEDVHLLDDIILNNTTTNNNTADETKEEEYHTTLLQESAYIQANLHSQQLEAVHTAENQMIHITSLLTQFSSLIQEQQEELQMIQDKTKNSTSEVEKGQEQLVTNVTTRKKAKHYMAKLIILLSFILLFMNYITP